MKTFEGFYSQKAARFPDTDPLGYIRYLKAIRLADLEPGARVLDLACKRASFIRVLAHTGPEGVEYVGLDLAIENIERNRREFPDTTFVVGDVMDEVALPACTFDRVFALEVMEHVPMPTRLLENARRLLADDGHLLLSVPNPYYWIEIVNELRGSPDTEGHIYAWSDANLRRLLDFAGFVVEARVGTYLEIPYSLSHPFARGATLKLQRIPGMLARSRVYRCRKSPD